MKFEKKVRYCFISIMFQGSCGTLFAKEIQIKKFLNDTTDTLKKAFDTLFIMILSTCNWLSRHNFIKWLYEVLGQWFR